MEPVIECEEIDDSRIPLRQGDVLEWLGGDGDPWRQHAIIVTADCDIAHSKHDGVLACVPVLHHETYLAQFALPLRLVTARDKLLEQARRAIREAQEANRPDFPEPMTDQTLTAWIDGVPSGEIVAALRLDNPRQATKLGGILEAIRECAAAIDGQGFAQQVKTLAEVLVLQQGGDADAKSTLLAREALNRLGGLPGDAVFIHALSSSRCDGYVVYLRFIVNIAEGEIATS